MKTFLTFIFSMVVLSTWTIAQTPKQQLAQAQAKAAEEKKDLLFIVNAAPWHQVSNKFQADILATEVFKKGITSDFVPVTFVYPQYRNQAHTDLIELQQKYRIVDMPMIILMDAYGRPYALTDGLAKDPEAYLKTLAELRKVRIERDKLFAKALDTRGLPRAEFFVEALKSLPQDYILEFYASELTYIAEGDPENKITYIEELQKAEALRQEKARYNMLFRQKKYDEVLNLSKQYAKKYQGEDLQRVRLQSSRAHALLQQFDLARTELKGVVELAPDSIYAEQVPKYLKAIARAEEQQKTGSVPAQKPKKPLVSSPVAVVKDISDLENKAAEIAKSLKAVKNKEAELSRENGETLQKITSLQAELKQLRALDKAQIENLEKLVAEKNAIAQKAKTMQQVIENHHRMNRAKLDITELEKKAKELKDESEDLSQAEKELRLKK